PRDHEALDLPRALDDVHRLHVAVELLDVVVAGDARVAQDLDREARRLLRHAGRERLRHRGLDLVRLLQVRQVGGAPAEETARLDLPRHARELLAHALVTRDGPVERITGAREVAGRVVRRARDADRHGGDRGAGRVEAPHRALEAGAL